MKNNGHREDGKENEKRRRVTTGSIEGRRVVGGGDATLKHSMEENAAGARKTKSAIRKRGL